jgi:hypothetical protein
MTAEKARATIAIWDRREDTACEDPGVWSEKRKSTIPLRITLSISNHNPDKRRFGVFG